ncbi:hypothetical protein FQV39_28345 [Bosea sp. F3-2]|uniref:hypothetical protein n=1 Tax=Bosea sp. F3-2 TaxID=2599640 RepID=UPI0011EE4C3C|nr:hypothetical protein [Bosea sp. F3-2]QEL26080.1 hypothetical protein FQV39_28345 [Bosea sp. F3-2]
MPWSRSGERPGAQGLARSNSSTEDGSIIWWTFQTANFDPLNGVCRMGPILEAAMINAWAITTRDNKRGEKDCDIVFKPAAVRVRDAYKAGYSEFGNGLSYPENRDDFLKKIDMMAGGLDLFAYFGHGFNTQLGGHILTKDDIGKLADALKPKMKPGSSIVFYSCLAGSAGGLTTMLLDRIGLGVWIYGHTTSEHSFKNPSVSEVHNGDGPKFKMLNTLFGPSLQAAWAESLARTDLWLRFPLMQHADIIKELNAIRLVGTWSVPGGGKYIFEWPIKNGTYATDESLCVNPNGTVRDASGKTGTWEMDDELVLSWGGASKEFWVMPINPDGQRMKSAAGVAKRIARGKYGSVQG